MKKIVFLLTTLVLVQITGMTAFASNIEEVSEENLKRAISAYKHGVELVRVKAYDSAIEAFNKALIYHPKMTDAYFNIDFSKCKNFRSGFLIPTPTVKL